jgi:N6-L-threonylcarbamoyladenine synthase
VVEVLVTKAMMASEQTGRDKLALAGGVAANSLLRKLLKEACDKAGITLYCPSIELCTDNAAMIGCAAYYRYLYGQVDGLDLDAHPSLELL